MKINVSSLLALVLLSAAAAGAGNAAKPSQRLGDSIITFLGWQDQVDEHGTSDHHRVAVRLRAENIGKQALCVSFNATLKTTFSLEYQGTLYTHDPFQIKELLPGERSEGEFVFSVKNGTQPLELVLKPLSQSQTCIRGKDSFSAIWHGADALRFDLSSERSPATDQKSVPVSHRPETAKARVLLTGRNGATVKDNAVKTFFNHCPQVLITTDKEAANYVVELVQSSFRQSRNSVVVTNKAGDVLYSGTTFNFGNAARDACTAVLRDLGRSPQP